MATNDFLPFAYGGGANVLSQSAYAALTTLLSGGYQSGVANSAQMNKTWRQSSIMAAVLGQFAADYSGNNSTDDGTTATLEANLLTAIRNAVKTGVILADTGTANAYTAVNAPPLVAGTWVDGVVQQVKIAHANTGASTYAPDGLPAIPFYGLGLQPLQGGELVVGGTAILMRATIAGVNSGNPICVLMECFGGAQQIAPATRDQHAVQLGQMQAIGITKFVTKSAAYTVTAADAGTLFYNSATVTYTLPDATTVAGKVYGFQNNQNYAPTVNTVGSQQIISENLVATSVVLSKSKSQMIIISDGANWVVLSASPSVNAQNVAPAANFTAVTIGANGTFTTQVTFTAPRAGVVYAQGALNFSSAAAAGIAGQLSINSTNVSSDNTVLSQSHMGTLAVTGGQSVIVQMQATSGSTSPAINATLRVGAFFVPNP